MNCSGITQIDCTTTLLSSTFPLTDATIRAYAEVGVCLGEVTEVLVPLFFHFKEVT